jgi:hypothetical protein
VLPPHPGGDGGQKDRQPALPEPPAGGGVRILADGPGRATSAVKVQLNDLVVPPGQRKKSENPAAGVPEQPFTPALSLPSLLAVRPPSATPTPADEAPVPDDKPGKGPKGPHAEVGQNSGSTSADSESTTNAGEEQPAPAIPLPTALQHVLHPTPTQTQTAAPTPTATPTSTATGTDSPATTAQPSTPASAAAPAATGWHIDGLALQNAAPDPTGKGGSAKFRKALRAALSARPDADRPSPAALRQWSTALQKAASLAPDARTKAQLRMLSRYTRELAGTAGPKRTALQATRPGALAAASSLRASLPQRFGVALLD